MSQNRVLIIVLVVLVIIFLVGIVGGLAGGNNNRVNSNDLKNGFFGTVHDLLVRPQHLAAEDIQVAPGFPSSCLQGSTLVVPQGGACKYAIRERGGTPVRTIKLNASAGSRANLTLEPQGAMKGTLQIPNSNPNKNLDVYEKGGNLTVECIIGDVTGSCRLTLN